MQIVYIKNLYYIYRKFTTMHELREKAQAKVTELIEGKFYSKMDLSRILKISYPTVYKRLENKDWTGKEINIILNEL